jgi:hypothetical protein
VSYVRRSTALWTSQSHNEYVYCLLCITDKTSLKADREDWGGGSLKPPQNIRKTNASGTIGTGGPAAPRNQRNPKNPSKIKVKHIINTHHNSSRNHQGSSRISQNHF